MAGFKLVVDSCCELPAAYWEKDWVERVPLEMEVGGEIIVDDHSFAQRSFLDKVAACPTAPKSSCPSPERYMQAFDGPYERIYVVTLSSHLSGSYNSAVLGKNLYQEKYGDKQIHIFDSWSASCGETQIALKIEDLERQGLDFAQVVEAAESYRRQLKTYFILDNLETLRKNGRLTGVKAFVASKLNIKPVMGATEGIIVQRGQGIGFQKGMQKIAELVAAEVENAREKRMVISHVNALERAEKLRDMILAKSPFAQTIVLDTAGISSMYANEGGLIVAV